MANLQSQWGASSAKLGAQWQASYATVGLLAAPSPLGAPAGYGESLGVPAVVGLLAAPGPSAAPAGFGYPVPTGLLQAPTPAGDPAGLGFVVPVGALAAPTPAADPAGAAVHLRYEIRGAVRIGETLVERTVRVHRLTDGALLGEVLSPGGYYRCPAGLDDTALVYAIALDLDDPASDTRPPVRNRLAPVLADDTAAIDA